MIDVISSGKRRCLAWITDLSSSGQAFPLGWGSCEKEKKALKCDLLAWGCSFWPEAGSQFWRAFELMANVRREWPTWARPERRSDRAFVASLGRLYLASPRDGMESEWEDDGEKKRNKSDVSNQILLKIPCLIRQHCPEKKKVERWLKMRSIT